MASAATVPSPPRQRVLTFAERQHLSDQRRAAVLAQRQAERAKRREEQARRRTANSASPGYDPTAYAARRGHRRREARGSSKAKVFGALRRRRRAARARAASRLLPDDARDAELPYVTCPAGVALSATVGKSIDAPSGLLLLTAAARHGHAAARREGPTRTRSGLLGTRGTPSRDVAADADGPP